MEVTGQHFIFTVSLFLLLCMRIICLISLSAAPVHWSIKCLIRYEHKLLFLCSAGLHLICCIHLGRKQDNTLLNKDGEQFHFIASRCCLIAHFQHNSYSTPGWTGVETLTFLADSARLQLTDKQLTDRLAAVFWLFAQNL